MTMSLAEEALQNGLDDPSALRRVIGHADQATTVRHLKFAFLGCETNMPYGPIDHTALIFMDTLVLCFKESLRKDEAVVLTFRIFNVKAMDYPSNSEWTTFDGIIVPGSFSAAYDTDEWIQVLCERLQTHAVAKAIPTLGICFGHQVLAHSFADGSASKTPSGPRAGRFTMPTTKCGEQILGSSEVDLYYTHGDMVEALPATALSLGGNADVNIQAAAYFQSKADAESARIHGLRGDIKPFAVTFQGHPEFASSVDLGLHRTLGLIADAMKERGAIDAAYHQKALEDAHATYDDVHRDSIRVMRSALRALGFVP